MTATEANSIMSALAGYVVLAVSDINYKICLFGCPEQKGKDDLVIKDRVFEINGTDILCFNYVDVLKYVKNCIDSKKVVLRVKRPTHIKDLYLEKIPPGKRAIALAIENKAAARLERLKALKLIKEVNIGSVSDNFADVISGQVYITDFPGLNDIKNISNDTKETSTGTLIKNTEVIVAHKQSSRKNSNPNQSNMASAVMRPSGHASHYGNGQVSLDESHTEMAVDCPPSYVAAHPPNGGLSTPRLETPPPTPINSQAMQIQKGNTDRDLHAAAAVAANLPQPELDMTRIHRMRESMKRKKELQKRDRQVRDGMANEDNAEKLRKIKTMTPDEEIATRKKGVFNMGYEEDSVSEAESNNIQEISSLNVENIFAALQEISKDGDDPSMAEDLKFVKNLMQDDTFQESVDLHNTIAMKSIEAKTASLPVQLDVRSLLEEVDDDLTSSKESKARELAGVLSKQHMRGLFEAHDGVAEFANVPPPHPSAAPPTDAEDNILLQKAANYTTRPAKIVRVNKTNVPLGATVRVEEEGNVIISRVVVGGAAEKSGYLHEGDEILEVNGESMRGKDVNEVGDTIGRMSGLLKFLIIPAEGKVVANGQTGLVIDMNKEPVMHVRALFDYDAYDDMYLPCRELGLSFQKGDILHVMSQDDSDWWQAYREGDQDQITLPGLIPGQNFQHQLEVIRLSLEKKDEEPEPKKGFMCGRGKRKKKKTKPKKKENVDSVTESGDEIEVYEEMALYHQPESMKRPIVMIGPPNAGRHELRQRLVEQDRDRFAFAVPHTTRPRNDGEVDGQDYHFVSMIEFEKMISNNEFLEHGSFQKNLYGTTTNAVQKVIDGGKICVINLHAESLKLLKTTALKPYIIFIAPPSLERLRQNVVKEGKQIKEDELRKIIENARVIEAKYAHYFDETIRNTDLSRSYAELLRLINKLDTEPQWVPFAWIE